MEIFVLLNGQIMLTVNNEIHLLFVCILSAPFKQIILVSHVSSTTYLLNGEIVYFIQWLHLVRIIAALMEIILPIDYSIILFWDMCNNQRNMTGIFLPGSDVGT